MKFKLNGYYKLAIFTLLSLIGFLMINSYYSGIIAKNEYDKQFKYFTTSPLIQVLHYQYDRGIFSSQIHAELSLNYKTLNYLLSNISAVNNLDDESLKKLNQITIKYHTYVSHGLFSALLHGNFVLALAYSKTLIDFKPPLQKKLATFFANRDPLTVNNVLYLNHGGKVALISPSFNYNETISGVNIKWAGLKFIINYDSQLNQFTKNISMPLLLISAPTLGHATISALNYYSHNIHSINQIKIGTTKLSIGTINVNWKSLNNLGFNLGDLIHMSLGINSTDFLNSLDVINPGDFILNNLSYISTSSDDGSYFMANAKAAFSSLSTQHKIYGPLIFNLSLDHIAAKSFSTLAQIMENYNSANQDSNIQQQFLNQLKQAMGPILVADPIVKLDKFSLMTPNGLVDISGTATTQNFKIQDLYNQHNFINKIKVHIKLLVPKEVLTYLFILQMKYLLSAGNTQIDNKSNEALKKVVSILLDNQLSTWIKKGFIQQNKQQLSTDFKLENGVISLNAINLK